MPGIFGIFSKCEPAGPLLSLRAALLAAPVQREAWLQTELWSDDHFSGGRVHLGVLNPEPQPIHAADGKTISFFDGEVYRDGAAQPTPDAPEIASWLESPPRLGAVDAQFACFSYDPTARKLTLFSDRIGSRPVYFLDTPEFFAFASEAKCLLPLCPAAPELDEIGLMQYISFGWILSDRSWWSAIKVLPSATVLEVTPGSLKRSTYWSFAEITAADSKASEGELSEEFGRLWAKSVAQRSRPGRTPFLLSGGLDSRVLLAEMVAQGQSVTAITFGAPDSSDICIAKTVAQLAGAEHRIFPLTLENWWDGRERAVWQTDAGVAATHLHVAAVGEALHSGNGYSPMNFMGDVIFGGSFLRSQVMSTWPHSLADLLRPFFVENPFYSFDEVVEASAPDLLADCVGPSSDCFWLRRRAARFTLNGPLATASHGEAIFPSFSLPLLRFAYGTLTDEKRKGNQFYGRVLLDRYPRFFRDIPWQRPRPKNTEASRSPVVVRKIRGLGRRIRQLFRGPDHLKAGIADYNPLVRAHLREMLAQSTPWQLDQRLAGRVSPWLRSFAEGQGGNVSTVANLFTAELYFRRCQQSLWSALPRSEHG